MKFEYVQSAELSDIGKKRKNNEDSCLCLPSLGVFCVADGMGGAAGGDLASEAVTTSIREVYTKATTDELGSLESRMAIFQRAVNQASKWIKNFADEKVIRGMGSTVVGLLFDPLRPSRALALHAGDSRLYRWRSGRLEVLTVDHTAAAALAVALGREEKSLPKKYQNELVRAVGLSEQLDLERTPVQVQSGDVFVLCSDGLTRMLADKQLAELLAEHPEQDSAALATTLVDAANQAGGQDNITVVLIRVGVLPEASQEDSTSHEAQTVLPPPKQSVETPVPAPVKSPSIPRHDTTDTYEGRTPQTPETPEESTDEERGAQPPPSKRQLSIRSIAASAGTALVVVCLLGWWAYGRRLKAGGGRQPLVTQSVVIASAGPSTMTRAVSADSSGSTAPAMTVTSVSVSEEAPTVSRGILEISSDPSGAELWCAGEPIGITPTNLTLAVGQYDVVVKYDKLEAKHLSVSIGADQSVTTKVLLDYGQMEVNSEPVGAIVRHNGRVVGNTPLSMAVVKPGPASLTLTMDGFLTTNVTVDVQNHTQIGASVKLMRAQERVMAGGASPGPAASVTAGKSYETNVVVNRQPPALLREAATVWTNQLGMQFVFFADRAFWACTTHVTPEQYARVMGVTTVDEDHRGQDGARSCVTGINLTEAQRFVERLGQYGVPDKGAVVFRLPNGRQWLDMVAAVQQGRIDGMTEGHLRSKYVDWCWDPVTAQSGVGKLSFKATRAEIVERPPDNGLAATIRVFIVPAEPAPSQGADSEKQ